MTAETPLIAIYDFEFFPYALGDVLTWNIRTAMRCDELGKKQADIYICLDERHPASIYQQGSINPDNYELFFTELYSAFGTNPRLGNIFIFRQRESMLEQLHQATLKDKANLEAFHDYLALVKKRVAASMINRILNKIDRKARAKPFIKKILSRFAPTAVKNTLPEQALNNYFIKYVYSHEAINQFAAQKGYIPLLQASLGCTADVNEIIARKFTAKKIVAFHLRLRRLDVGYAGDHTYDRDSSFLEWYDFLRQAAIKHPHVQFIALGRLQEKPLEILRLPNVASLRIFGMGLGHELTLMLKSDLFIGTSSGFAALANFSTLPYFITRMNPGSCKAYAIPDNAEYLPFAKENQKLVYEQETSGLLMQLLETGLALKNDPSNTVADSASPPSPIDINEWLKLHKDPYYSARTTCRFYDTDKYRNEETAYLLLPYFDKIEQALIEQQYKEAELLLNKLQVNFPELCQQFPTYQTLKNQIEQFKIDRISS